MSSCVCVCRRRRVQSRAAEMQRQSMIAACMTPPARERLARIAIVKPEKARFIEEYIVKNARTVRARLCVYIVSCSSTCARTLALHCVCFLLGEWVCSRPSPPSLMSPFTLNVHCFVYVHIHSYMHAYFHVMLHRYRAKHRAKSGRKSQRIS